MTARAKRLYKISFPLFVTQKNKYFAAVLFAIYASVLYLSSNHYHLFPPQYLPMWWIDRAVPFMPHFIWIYLSEYFFFVTVYFTCKDMVNLNKYLYSFGAIQTVSVIIFTLWPTTYPRELFPLPADLDYWTYTVFNNLRTTDTPANCCPSLHVSSVYLSTFIFLDEQRKKFPFFFLWGTAIALSTLPTKQHYLVDVITGLMMAVVFYFVFHKMIDYYPWGKRPGKAQAKR